VALKIINSDDTDDARHEKEIESHITQQDSEQRGRVILRTCLDHFEVTGPEGTHMCFVYEPMRGLSGFYRGVSLTTRFLCLLRRPISTSYLSVLIIFTQIAKSSTQVSTRRRSSFHSRI
jgi:hypothetical protein